MPSDSNNTYKTFRERILRHLSEKNLITEVSKQFSKLEKNNSRVSFVYDLLESRNLLPGWQKEEKSNKVAVELRQRGNEMFKLKNSERAWEFYTKSLLFCEENCENAGLAYANRSAVLFEMKMYEECLRDIDLASGHNYPENLKDKLTNRRQKANDLKNDQIKNKYHHNIPNKSSQNVKIQCASDNITIEYTKNLGRHIIAKKDILPGEILAIEQPYCKILLDSIIVHCHECLNICYNLVPCKGCTKTLYCSERCKEIAHCKYHKYECGIVSILDELETEKLKRIAVRIAIQSKSEYAEIWNSNLEETEYMSDRYKEIHCLVGNTEYRTVSDLFERALFSAVVFDILKKCTTFFDDEGTGTSFKEILLTNLQTGPCNFHEISELHETQDGVFEPMEIGTGCYSFLSMLNHACSPNVLRNCYGSTIVLRALSTIKCGEQCFDNYGYHHAVMPLEERKNHLKSQYFFTCECQPCKENWPLYQFLPDIGIKLDLDSFDITSLQKADFKTAEAEIEKAKCELKIIEKNKPCKNWADLLEILKQCYSIFGNVKRTI